MTDWFRSWHGAPTDPKWRTIAKRAGVAPSLVVSLAWVLLDRASQAETRGSIDGIDVESIADFLGCETEDVERVVAAMHDKAVLTSDRFTAWDRRQAKRERDDDTAAERKAAQRARDKSKSGSGDGGTGGVTPRHATSHQVTPREEESREDNSSLRSSQPCAAPAGEPSTSTDTIELKLRQAAKAEENPSPGLCDVSPIYGLLEAGFDLERDILPVIRSKPNPKLRSWSYFVDAVRDSAEKRRGAAAKPAPRPTFVRTPADPSNPVIDFGNGYSAPESTIRSLHSKGRWLDQWGPKRGEPGCKVPERVFEQAMPS